MDKKITRVLWSAFFFMSLLLPWQIFAADNGSSDSPGQQLEEKTQFQQNTLTRTPPGPPAPSFNDVLDRAEKGDAQAEYMVGRMYYYGNGVTQDMEKAAEWQARAAAQGNVSAEYVLGLMYSTGEGVHKDKEKAVEWISKAAEQGLAEAQHALGMMYRAGEDVPQDNTKAEMWLSKAAAQGHEEAK